MGIFKNLKGTAGQLRARAGTLAHQHHGKAEQAIDKAGAAADTRTGGKYRDKLGTARQKAHGGLDSLAAQQSGTGPASAPTSDPMSRPPSAPAPEPVTGSNRTPDPEPTPAPRPQPPLPGEDSRRP